MICRACDGSNRDGAKFCGFCGSPLVALPPLAATPPVLCPVCHNENAPAALFCEFCGVSLEVPPPTAEGPGTPLKDDPADGSASQAAVELPHAQSDDPQVLEVVPSPSTASDLLQEGEQADGLPQAAARSPAAPDAVLEGEQDRGLPLAVPHSGEGRGAVAFALPIAPLAAPAEGAAEAEPAQSDPTSPLAGLTCGACGTVIRYCPSCGQLLDTLGQHPAH